MRVRLRLLDGFCLLVGDQPVEVAGSTERLLALLALRPKARRETVAGTLWPDVLEHQALASLRTSLWRINRMAPGLVVAEGRALTLATTVAVDIHEQEAFVVALLRARQMDITAIQDGVASLWPRELLPGWYDEWVVVERERLNQLRLHALERAAALLTAHGDFDRGLDLAVEAVRTEPLRESANEQLVRVHLARGNVYDALRQFDVYRRLVAAELDTEPCAPLRALVAPWVRRGSDAAAGARPALGF